MFTLSLLSNFLPSLLYLQQIDAITPMVKCKNCGDLVTAGKFCYACGHKLNHERLKLPNVLKEVLHTYTHLEGGFLYNIKQLALHPGTLQKNYLSGIQIKTQKPFPMFVICGTISALVLYLTSKPFNTTSEQYFYKNYYVLLQALMLPVYSLSTWLFFYSSKLYYAEVLILTVYMLGFMLLLVIPINFFHFLSSTQVISYIEMIILAGYNVWTNLNFFSNKPAWLVLIKSIISIFICYMLFQIVAEFIISFLK